MDNWIEFPLKKNLHWNDNFKMRCKFTVAIQIQKAFRNKHLNKNAFSVQFHLPPVRRDDQNWDVKRWQKATKKRAYAATVAATGRMQSEQKATPKSATERIAYAQLQ